MKATAKKMTRMALYRAGVCTSTGRVFDSLTRLALSFTQLYDWGLGSATDPIPLPKAKPRTMREHFVVPSIRSREVAWAQRSVVRHSEDTFQPFDFSNGIFSVHPSQSSSVVSHK